MIKLSSALDATTASDTRPLFRSERANSNIDYAMYCILGITALVFLSTAALGYFSDGYHWGFDRLNRVASYLPHALLHNITIFGDGVFLVCLILIVANRKPPILLTTLVGAVIAGIITQSLKRSIDAARPPAVLDLDTFNLIGSVYFNHSFPSGHTLTAFLTATSLICFSRRRSIQITLFALASMVGCSRVWLGVHWPIDALVGAALGIFCGLLAFHLCGRSEKTKHNKAVTMALILFSLIACSALVHPNDYVFAQPAISLAAVLALWKTFNNYLRPSILTHAPTTTDALIRNTFLCILIATVAYRILVMFQPHLNLFYDEAYYYHWSLTPDFGYYSKPPFVAWLIAASTYLAGHTVIGVKIASPILYGLSAFIIFATARKVASVKAGIIAGLVFLSAPVVGFNSVFITTDAPLIFFWSASLYLFADSLRTNQVKYWLLLGVSVGCGMLSKYTMAALPLSLFAFMLYDNNHRAKLLSYKPWLGAGVAGLFFSLNLWWNSQNEWVSFRHTSEISQLDDAAFNLLGLAEYLAGQIFVLGPISFYLLVVMICRRKRYEKLCKPNYSGMPNAFLFTSAGIVLLIALQALGSRALINWAAPWVVGAALFIGISASRIHVTRYLRAGLISQLVLISAFYHWPYLLDHFKIEQSRKNNPYQRLAGWVGVAEQLKPILDNYPDHVLASDSRDLLAYLGFHTKPGQIKFARWNANQDNIQDHYDLKYNLINYSGSHQGFIFVSKKALSPTQLSKFDSAFSLGHVTQEVYHDKSHTIFVYRVIGFNGYE